MLTAYCLQQQVLSRIEPHFGAESANMMLLLMMMMQLCCMWCCQCLMHCCAVAAYILKWCCFSFGACHSAALPAVRAELCLLSLLWLQQDTYMRRSSHCICSAHHSSCCTYEHTADGGQIKLRVSVPCLLPQLGVYGLGCLQQHTYGAVPVDWY